MLGTAKVFAAPWFRIVASNELLDASLPFALFSRDSGK